MLLEEFKNQKTNNITYKNEKIEEEAVSYKFKITKVEYLLAMVFSNKEFVKDIKEHLILQVFKDSPIKDIYKNLIETYNVDDDIEKFGDELLDRIKIWELFVEEKNSGFSDADKHKECINLIKMVNIENLQSKERAIVSNLNKVSEKSEQEGLVIKLQEIQKLKKIIIN